MKPLAHSYAISSAVPAAISRAIFHAIRRRRASRRGPTGCITTGSAALRAGIVAVALAFVGAQPAAAHEDVPLTLAAGGTLGGLPAAYGPGRLAVGFASVDGAPHVASLALALKGGRVEVPACVLGLLNSTSPGDVAVSASWDHDEAVVPYYLQVVFRDPGPVPGDWARPGFTLLFDLRGARLLGVDVAIAHPAGQWMQTVPVDLHARCDADELAPVLAPAPATVPAPAPVPATRGR